MHVSGSFKDYLNKIFIVPNQRYDMSCCDVCNDIVGHSDMIWALKLTFHYIQSNRSY